MSTSLRLNVNSKASHPAKRTERCAARLGALVLILFAAVADSIGAQEQKSESKTGASAWPGAESVDAQPLISQARRVGDALGFIGAPLSEVEKKRLAALAEETDDKAVARGVQELFDPHCLAAVEIAANGSLTVVPASGTRELVEQGWRVFLVKVVNRAESTTRLRVSSPNARPLPRSPKEDVDSRWLGLATFDRQPLQPALSGLALEYRLVEIYSTHPGERRAAIDFAIPAARSEDQAGSGEIKEWRFDKDAAGWKVMNQTRVEAKDGALVVRGTGDDPSISTTIEPTGKTGPMVLRIWARSEEKGFGQIFWSTENRPRFDGNHQGFFNLEAGQDSLYEIPFRADGPVTGLRIDPNVRPGTMRIDWIELSSATQGITSKSATLAFKTVPATPVTFRVADAPGLPAMACFEITDSKGRVYPPLTKRLAPDFFFHKQIYRGDGETVALPPGKYTIRSNRGPESVPEVKQLEVGSEPATFSYKVNRWIDPSRRGYWSGDHHIHAAGCAHYESPTEGVHPPDMMRHCLGEDLKVGCCLTWGPCFDYQKRFFTGKPDDVSKPPYILRYDVEVSGFGSHQSGHLNLLRLSEQIPPGGDSKNHWPTLGLNTLRWAKRQGAVCGPAHSAIGLSRYIGRVPDSEGKDGPNGLPNYNIPAYDGIGANEFVMNVTHEVEGPDGRPRPAVDFISTMNTDRRAEWNMWYHVLNCGFRVKASGETDFPCVSGERVGMGRVYAKVDGALDFDLWCDSIAAGRSYVSDGTSHLMELTAEAGGRSVELGVKGSELGLPSPGKVKVNVIAAARVSGRENVPVELVVNGFPAASRSIPADGSEQKLEFEADVAKSSWIAVRILRSAHTNPIFVLVDGKPIRASRLSAEWCLRGVDQCWKSKLPTYRQEEHDQAEKDYDHAREVYRKIRDESLAEL